MNRVEGRKNYKLTAEIVCPKVQISNVLSYKPPVGSCHHGMARPLGCGWGSRPPDMEVSSEYIE